MTSSHLIDFCPASSLTVLSKKSSLLGLSFVCEPIIDKSNFLTKEKNLKTEAKNTDDKETKDQNKNIHPLNEANVLSAGKYVQVKLKITPRTYNVC